MIYKRKGKSPNWYVIQNIKTSEGKWKTKWICTGTADEDEAKRFDRRILDGMDRIRTTDRVEKFLSEYAKAVTGETVKSSRFPLSQVWNTYEKKPVLSSNTERTKKSKKTIWNRFYLWVQENYSICKYIDDVTAEMANDFLKQFHKSSPKTYNNYRHNLSHLWQEMSIDSGMTSNIWKLVSKPARMTGEVYRPFSDDEIQKILENSETFWRSASIISCHTGLRLKDIVLLEWKQIDMETKEIKLIPHKIARYNKTIAIPLHDDILAMLRTVPKTGKKYVFPEVIHKHKENSEFHSVFTKILETSGIKDNDKGIVGFHSWRKTFTTNASGAGIELEEIRKMVGHSKIEMTEHYNHSKVTEKLRNMKSITKGGK